MDPISTIGAVVGLIQVSESIVKGCAYYVTNVKNAKEDITRLLQEADALSRVLQSLKSLVERDKVRVADILSSDIERCSSVLVQLKNKIDPGSRKKSALGIISPRFRTLKWPLKRLELESSIENIERFKTTFTFALSVDQMSYADNTNRKVTFDQLQVARGATFDAYGSEHAECLPGTRVELLTELEDWAKSPDGKSICWLSGRAGTGKSTISRTIASRLQEIQLLGASFFFKRGEESLVNAQRLFPTLVQQLIHKVPQISSSVQKAIEEDNNISEKALREQFEKLLLQPLQEVRQNPSITLVVVIDALDECEREDDIRILLRLLPRLQTVDAVRLRFLLTGRPELSIRQGFREINDDHRALTLHDIAVNKIEWDISLFLRHELLQIRKDRGNDISHDWPGEETMVTLVKMSTPLFIFAATVCRMLQDPQWAPEDSLKDVLSGQGYDSKLDQTYLPVLNRLTVSQNSKKAGQLIEEYRRMIGTLFILQTPLPRDALSELTNISRASMQQRLNSLHSVLIVPENEDQPVELFHRSFRDFLLDVDTRDKTPLWIEEEDAHRDLTTQCLGVMRQSLRKNICSLSSYGTLRSEINSLSIQQSLKPELQYSCRFWASHLLRSGNFPDALLDAFEFLKEHLLHWIEAMSILGAGAKIVGIIADLRSVPQLDHCEISQFLYDAGRLILRNRYILDTAPLQIYSSGLTFAPKSSIIRTMFKDDIPGWIRGSPKVEDFWGAEIQILQGHSDDVLSVAFSPNGKLLASGAADGAVKLWDPTTGEMQQTLTGHAGGVYCVAFSSKFLATGSYDGTIKLWEPSSGELQHTLEHAGSNTPVDVAFSPHGLLASSAADITIKLWDPETGKLQNTLAEHGTGIGSVVFASDFLASSSTENTVKLWDPLTGELRYTLSGHTGQVLCLASSPGGLLASSAIDGTVKLWIPETGELCRTLHNGPTVRSLAFSQDGLTLVTCADDVIIRVWELSTGNIQNAIYGGDGQWLSSVAVSPTSQLLATASTNWTIKLYDPSIAHPKEIVQGGAGRHTLLTMEFSSDNQLLASGSSNGTLQLWDSLVGKSRWVSDGHSGKILCIAFSADSQILASGCGDKSIIIWSTATGAQLQKLLGHDDWVTFLKFSPDGKALASCSLDHTTKLWNLTRSKIEQSITLNEPGPDLAFSSDSRQIAAGARDRTIKLWNVATGRLEQTLEGHTAHVCSVTFSPGMYCPQLLASGSKDEIKLWDPVNAQLLHTFPVVDGSSDGLTFSQVGPFLYSETEQFCIREWCYTESLSTNSGTTSGFNNIPERATYVTAQETQWVYLQDKRVLYLPVEYRFYSSAMVSRKVAFGDRSEVLFVSVP